MSDGSNVLGMAWYTPAAWEQLAAMPEAKIEKNYQDFVRDFEAYVRRFEAQGVPVQKVTIGNVTEMVAGCHRHGYEINSRGRALYVSALALVDGDVVKARGMPFIDKASPVQ